MSTDSHSFFTSHAKHAQVNIPLYLASRLITIVNDDCGLERMLQEVVCYLECQHYAEEIILSGIQKSKQKGTLFFPLTKSRKEL